MLGVHRYTCHEVPEWNLSDCLIVRSWFPPGTGQKLVSCGVCSSWMTKALMPIKNCVSVHLTTQTQGFADQVLEVIPKDTLSWLIKSISSCLGQLWCSWLRSSRPDSCDDGEPSLQQVHSGLTFFPLTADGTCLMFLWYLHQISGGRIEALPGLDWVLN